MAKVHVCCGSCVCVRVCACVCVCVCVCHCSRNYVWDSPLEEHVLVLSVLGDTESEELRVNLDTAVLRDHLAVLTPGEPKSSTTLISPHLYVSVRWCSCSIFVVPDAAVNMHQQFELCL